MKDFAKIYFWYTNFNVKVARIFVFIIFGLLSIVGFFNSLPNLSIIPFSLFLIFEIFFKFKISKLTPKLEISQNTGDALDSTSLELLSVFEAKNSLSDVLRELIKLSQIQFIIYKADLRPEEIVLIDAEKLSLLQNAFNLAKELKGKYVTTMDFFAAYLLSIEPSAKLLFNKELKDEDLKNILLWAKSVFQREESSRKIELTLAGEGIAEEWVYGWTLETQKYMLDLSHEFLNEKREPIGRKNEYQQMVEALYSGKSVLLVGETGSGKETVAKELAIESFMGRLKDNLYHQKIFQLMVDAFMAGAQNQGELESRFNALIAEVAHSGNVVIYIPELQNILGSASFNLDISGGLIPYLQRKQIRIVATATPGNYKKFIEQMHTFLDDFAVINFSEPTREEVLKMLFEKAELIDDKDGVILTYKSILCAYNYAARYAKEKVLPGSAVTLLEDTANAVRVSNKRIVEEQDILAQIEKKIKAPVGEPRPVERALLLNLENELHKKVVGQNEAIFAISEAIRRLRTGMQTAEKPISFLFLGPTGVGKTETAKALAQVYFGTDARFVRFDMSEFIGEEGIKRLLGSGPGEGDEKGQLTEAVYDNPNSLILLDEFEKADQNILDLFLQVLDDGRLTDNKGKTISFANCIIIATSNAASEFVREEIGKGILVDKKFQESLINFLETNGLFKPELLNRFDDIVTFKPLEQAEITQITKLLLAGVIKNLEERDIIIYFDDKIAAKIATEGFDKDFGARPLKRFIQDKIEDLIAQEMLREQIKRGDKVLISVDSSNNIVLSKA
jgi:ATP-dependent Clp protease ATP-binding subunit ClpC